MDTPKIFESEYRFCLILWENEPIKSGKLGTLENLEFITLTDRTKNTACVWVSDGFSYERMGAISEDLLQDLANLKTSKEEISLSRSEDRNKSHTIVLQSKKQTEASPAVKYMTESLCEEALRHTVC